MHRLSFAGQPLFASSLPPLLPPPPPPPARILTSSNGKHRTYLQPNPPPPPPFSSSSSSCPSSTAPAAPGATNTADITPQEVIGRIEEFIAAWIATLSNPAITEPPTFEVPRRTRSNTTYHDGANNGGDPDAMEQDQLPGLRQGDGMVVKKLKGKGARSYAAIFAVLAFTHRVLLSGQIATSRELWYHHKTSRECFKSQADCDRAVLDAAALLGVARHQLGIVGAAKGLLAGHFRFRPVGSGRAWVECDVGGGGGGGGEGGGGEGGGGGGGTLIDSSWISEVMEIECAGGDRPRYVVVVEKECVFKRLVGDGLCEAAGGVVLITGKGYPDLATRACLKALVEAFGVLVLGLSDCNPHGIALLLTYKCGSLRMPESQLYRVPLRWLGVRPLQILQRFDLPDDAFQYFSEGDVSKCRSLMASPFCQAHPRWKEEVEAMADEHMKCELEALNAFSGAEGRRDFLCQFVVSSLLSGDYLS